jgi:hypothetical protein
MKIFKRNTFRGMTERERKVYDNLQKVDDSAITDLAKSALSKLDSKDEKIKAYGTGMIVTFKGHDCYIGDWIWGRDRHHKWLPKPKRLIKSYQNEEFDRIIRKINGSNPELYNSYKDGVEHIDEEFRKLKIHYFYV